MSKVTFDIEFTVNGLIQLIGRASVSRKEAESIQGLTDNLDTVIRLDVLQGQTKMEVEPPPKQNKGGRKKKPQKVIKEKSVKISDQNDEDDLDDIDEDDAELDLMNIQPQIQEDYEDYYDSDNEDVIDDDNDDDDDQLDMIMNFENKKRTKRQRGELELDIELPLKKSRRKNIHDEDDMLKKMEKDQKRRQQMKRHVERQRMDTLNQILNETGRKQRLRNEKETKDKQSKQNKIFKSLGDVPKITLHLGQDEEYLIVHKTSLFSQQMLKQPVIRTKKDCYRCGNKGKYRVQGDSMVCSLGCYKDHQSQQPKKMEVEA